MKDKDKTQEQFIHELAELRRRIAELEALEAEHKRLAQETREYAESIVDTVREGLLVLDADLRVISANRSFYETFKVKPEETEGQLLYDLGNRQWDIPKLRELLEEILPTDTTFDSFEVEHEFKIIGRRVMHLNARRIYREIDETHLILLAIEDATERKRAEQALRQSSEKLKFFAYSVMHDLKSPTIGIYGLTELLHKHYKDTLDERGKSYCDQILRASVHVATLIEMINVYIATKESPLKIEKINIKDILQMVRDDFSPRLVVRRIKWLEPEVMVEVKADKLSLLRVFRNFVDNALKYGGEDLSEIRIGYEESEEFHTLSISDDGAGMREGDYERIFEAFRRGETYKAVEGVGLGLAIVAEIAERHKGRVWAEPLGDRWTTFHVSIAKDL
ncbi:MAG: PAS domain-containing protein [Deltaproteobacteria bacterium]|nr:PAS domain-containing protein [Deltaproteobacteria bacterium]